MDEMYNEAIDNLRTELAAAQADNARLRNTLDHWLLATVNHRTEFAGERAITRKELAANSPDDALREYNAKLVEKLSDELGIYLDDFADKIRKGKF